MMLTLCQHDTRNISKRRGQGVRVVLGGRCQGCHKAIGHKEGNIEGSVMVGCLDTEDPSGRCMSDEQHYTNMLAGVSVL